MYCNVSLSTAFCAKKVPANKIKKIGESIEKKASESIYTSPFMPTGAATEIQKTAASMLDKQAMNTRIPFNVLEEQARQEAKEKAAKLAAEEAKNAYPPVPFN